MTSKSVLACALTAFILTVVACGVRAGNIVLIPSGFEGWVVIRYEVPGESSLGREGAKTMLRVPVSGSLITSSDMPRGYGIDEYYFVGADGKRTPIQNEPEGCKDQDVPCVQQFEFVTSPVKVTIFFVGKKPNLARYPKPKVP